jgi:hypothetical protein
LKRGLHGVLASQFARAVRSAASKSIGSARAHSARNVNSFMIPITLRLAVGASLASCIWASSVVMKLRGTSCAASAWARWSGKRARSVAAGASGIKTGNSVASLTRSATCGFQNQAVAYQSPSRVVETSPGRRVNRPTRSRSFLVARTTSTFPILPSPTCTR